MEIKSVKDCKLVRACVDNSPKGLEELSDYLEHRYPSKIDQWVAYTTVLSDTDRLAIGVILEGVEGE